jgi:hypothetical protein
MRHPANVPLPIHPFVGKGFIPAERRPFLCLSLYTDRSGVYPAPQSAVWCAKVKRPDREPSRAVLILETHSQPYPSQQLTLHIRPIHSPRHSAHMITPPWDVSVNAPPPLAQLLLLPREARQRSALVHQLGCAHSVYQAIKYTISVGSVTTLHHFRPISNTLGTPPESRHSKEISVSKQSRRWRQQQQTTTTKLGPYFDLYCYVFIHAANMLGRTRFSPRGFHLPCTHWSRQRLSYNNTACCTARRIQQCARGVLLFLFHVITNCCSGK